MKKKTMPPQEIEKTNEEHFVVLENNPLLTEVEELNEDLIKKDEKRKNSKHPRHL